MNLIQALKKQIDFCEKNNGYNCGIFVTTEKRQKTVIKAIEKILTENNTMKLIATNFNTNSMNIVFPSGSLIRVKRLNNLERGCRFNGLIIENTIHSHIVNKMILPLLMPMKSKEIDMPSTRIYFCPITYIENETCIKNKNLEKEKAMYINENAVQYDSEYISEEIDNSKVLVYLAVGIPKQNISYETEFINRTKETYLNIKGSVESTSLNFSNEINIHLKIDTEIYYGYSIIIENGLIIVSLYEIENEAPILVDYTN